MDKPNKVVSAEEMNKKASLQDFGYMVVLIFVLAIAFISFSAGWNPTIEIMKNQTAFQNDADATAALQTSQNLQSRFDGVIFSTLIAFFLAIIIVSWYVPTDSIFAIIYLIGLIIFIVLSLVFSYVWDKQIITIPAFAGVLHYFPLTNYILQNFGILCSVIGFTGLIILFSKPNQTYVQG